MSRKNLKHKSSTISYLQFGKGDILLIAFHGYAIEADFFLKLEDALAEKYTVIAIDLPFHGETKVDAFKFQKQDLLEVIHQIISFFPKKKEIEFMGYSYGGRVVLEIFSHFKVNHLWLLAPDGLEKKLNYNLPIYSVAFRHFLAKLLKNPTWFLKLINGLNYFGLFPKYTHRFMTRHLESKTNRERLFGTWIFLHKFIIYRNELERELKKTRIGVSVIYGSKDTIIDSNGGLDLEKRIENVNVYFVEAGHKILGENLVIFLKELFQKVK